MIRRVVWPTVLLLIAMLLAPIAAVADVDKQGEWPEEDAKVTLDVEDMTRSDALRELAEAAGWSIVVQPLPADRITVRVVDQPANKVLELVLADGQYVATRDGDLISIALAPDEDEAEAPEAADDSSENDEREGPKETRRDARDVVMTGRSVTIDADDVVGDVTVMGGSLDVYGTALGDVTVMGGSAHLHADSRVEGDATAVGGSLTVDDDARVDGDVGVVGGVLIQGDDAIIGGEIEALGSDDQPEEREEEGFFSSLASRISNAITNGALLFVFGAVMLALGAARMEKLSVEVAARPMRSFALGIVGSIAALILVIALCVTVVGIPLALVGILLAIVAVFAALCATLTTLGGALVSHRSHNVYVHLAVGCVLYIVAGVLPWIGGLLQGAVVLASIGAFVATRGAGFFDKRSVAQGSGSPYR